MSVKTLPLAKWTLGFSAFLQGQLFRWRKVVSFITIHIQTCHYSPPKTRCCPFLSQLIENWHMTKPFLITKVYHTKQGSWYIKLISSCQQTSSATLSWNIYQSQRWINCPTFISPWQYKCDLWQESFLVSASGLWILYYGHIMLIPPPRSSPLSWSLAITNTLTSIRNCTHVCFYSYSNPISNCKCESL